jgi:hypothetical protein
MPSQQTSYGWICGSTEKSIVLPDESRKRNEIRNKIITGERGLMSGVDHRR